ncbi:class I SAM-dependent methyltransferase [Pseudoalteromonas ulvae]|uniref:Methyltransferase type 11 domain-containing protein n=1 Tax=Pseudoalteromonas ulvae TaxID=107327 RepID=A0A244CSC3_PSEDV|nr:class I SAM-dependent methyltransferase [Pseudoalteromonas ulvae]OUL58366.1 hypothetical protein B1199_08520 [Pseudoalteromonas ulvae]
MHWDRYWSETKRLSSFEEDGNDFGYPNEVMDFWKDQLNIRSDKLIVLDAATGKGAIAAYIKAILNSRHIPSIIHGCDLAEIETESLYFPPQLQTLLETIRFDYGVGLEKLPYHDSYFDLVVSQFGFEYSNWELSIPEINRVLKKEGRLIFMAHHAKSIVSHNSLVGIEVLSSFIDNDVFLKLNEVISLKLNGEDDAFKEKNKMLINELNSYVIDSEEKAVWFLDIVNSISKLMRTIDETSIEKVQILSKSTVYQIDRLKDQLGVAQDTLSIKQKINKFDGLFKVLDIKEFYIEKTLFSSVVVLEKA